MIDETKIYYKVSSTSDGIFYFVDNHYIHDYLKDGLMKYETNEGKDYKWRVTPTKSQWIRLNETQQPKAFDWYNLNGKWIWTKWNGKLDV